jgi:hypothetical protein
MSTTETPSRRWSRSERFQLSEQGRAAAQGYLDGIVASRAEEGRRSFDDARDKWAKDNGLTSEDGLALRELVGKSLTLSELTERLDGYGPNAKQVKSGLLRLLSTGMVEPVPSPNGG